MRRAEAVARKAIEIDPTIQVARLRGKGHEKGRSGLLENSKSYIIYWIGVYLTSSEPQWNMPISEGASRIKIP